MSDPFAPISGKPSPARSKKPDDWSAVFPVPEDAPPPPAAHWERGKPHASWTYRDGDDRLLGLVWRFNGRNGEKEFLPLTFCRKSNESKSEWRFKSWDAPRPLYGLDKLAERPSAPVLLCEGEKSADAAQRLFAAVVAIASAGGSKAAGKTDWRPLKGRDVTIWPDADEAGGRYAEEAARAILKAGALSVAVIPSPQGVAKGWDAADAEAQGWSGERAQAMATSAQLFHTGANPGATHETGRKRPRQTDGMISIVEKFDVELWCDEDGDAYATMPVNGHFENCSLRSREFRRWLAGHHYAESGGALGGQAMEDGLRVLEAKAAMEGGCHATFRRIGEMPGRIFIDLCDDRWRAIEVRKNGWQVISKPPCKFLRGPSMRALPEPDAGWNIDALRGFINVESDEDFKLIVAWLVGALRPRGPYPVLCINGEQGAGKSILARVLRDLTDPNASPLRAAPEKDRDLFVAAFNSWVLGLDNLSSIPEWLSDALCRIATGGGLSVRTLHSDKEETFFFLSRPIILNGIPSLTGRADLADRAITIFLRAIPEASRRTEAEFWREFNAAKPSIIGALLDALSAALENLTNVTLEKVPRLADFAYWVTAAESSFGWDRGSCVEAYLANRREMAATTYEADPLAMALSELIQKRGPAGFDGKVSELLPLLNDSVSEAVRKGRSWPGSATALGSRLRRIAPLLRPQGMLIDWGHSGSRFVRILPSVH